MILARNTQGRRKALFLLAQVGIELLAVLKGYAGHWSVRRAVLVRPAEQARWSLTKVLNLQ